MKQFHISWRKIINLQQTEFKATPKIKVKKVMCQAILVHFAEISSQQQGMLFSGLYGLAWPSVA